MSDRRRDNALGSLTELTAASRQLHQRTETAVARAVYWGATWRQIADALEVTPQAAHKRYRQLRYDPATGTAWHEPPLPM
jgi:FixJ family two-component response regulator